MNGAQACHDILDSGDSTDLSISTASAGTLVAGQPSVVIGAASSSVSLNVVDTFADNKITEVSPANTAVDLSGYSPFYFRTAPPDSVQGNALGTLISQDGYTNIGFLVFNDTYGTGLRNAVQTTIEAAGGKCVYGCKGDGDEFPAGQTTFSAEVQAVTAAKPDAIVILAFDETKSIVPELAAAGFDMSKTYFSDGNTAGLQRGLRARHPRGRPGHHPRRGPDQGFKDRCVAWYEMAEGDAAQGLPLRRPSPTTPPSWPRSPLPRAASNDSVTVQKNFAAVSGATDGEECTTYADCLALHRGRQRDPLHRPVGHRPDRRRERPVVGVRRDLPVRRQQQDDSRRAPSKASSPDALISTVRRQGPGPQGPGPFALVVTRRRRARPSPSRRPRRACRGRAR